MSELAYSERAYWRLPLIKDNGDFADHRLIYEVFLRCVVGSEKILAIPEVQTGYSRLLKRVIELGTGENIRMPDYNSNFPPALINVLLDCTQVPPRENSIGTKGNEIYQWQYPIISPLQGLVIIDHFGLETGIGLKPHDLTIRFGFPTETRCYQKLRSSLMILISHFRTGQLSKYYL